MTDGVTVELRVAEALGVCVTLGVAVAEADRVELGVNVPEVVPTCDWVCDGVPVCVEERVWVELAVEETLGVAVRLGVWVGLELCDCERVGV